MHGRVHPERLRGAGPDFDLKLAAAVNGGPSVQKAPVPPQKDVRVAVVGAGPSGLARPVSSPGAVCGSPSSTAGRRPAARCATSSPVPDRPEAIAQDIEHVRRFGVDFAQETPENLTVESLRARGFTYVYHLAIGAGTSNPLPLDGDPAKVHDAVEFLLAFNRDASAVTLGRSVVVVGGGNSAMDGARAALRVPGVERVTIVYRRTEAQMPADREEFDNALADGVVFRSCSCPSASRRTGS